MKISVVLPVAAYNMEFVDRSVLSCTTFAHELIVVADEGCEFHPGFYNRGDFIKMVVVKEPGLSKALNAGIAVANHPWISFLCSDDYYDTSGMNLMASIIKTNPACDILGGQTRSFGHFGGIWPVDSSIAQMESHCCITSPALFRKSLWWKVRGYKNVRYPDWFFWKECLKAGASYIFESTVMYHYYAHDGTIGASYNYRSDLGHCLNNEKCECGTNHLH